MLIRGKWRTVEVPACPVTWALGVLADHGFTSRVHLTERERINLHAALASVEALLCNRHTPQPPKPAAPSP